MPSTSRTSLGTTSLDLTSLELAVLTHLAVHAANPMRRARLERIVRDGPDDESAPAKLNRIIYSVRAKFKSARPGSDLLKTKYGVGYYLDVSKK